MGFWQTVVGWFRRGPVAIPEPAVEPTFVVPLPVVPGPAPAVPAPLPAASQSVPGITLAEYLMGRDQLYPITDAMKADALTTVDRVNQLLSAFGAKRDVDSGYRPAAINDRTAGAAKNSKHEVCEACDLEDKDGKLWKWAVHNLDVLKALGLWMEDPRWTPDWLHVQIVPPESGHRVFVPSIAPAPAPKKWTGLYDRRFDGKV